MITALAFVGLAGAGTLVRFLLRERSSGRFAFPVATLFVNLSGCFLLGAIAGWSSPAATVVGTAGLGALTTYSTFAAEVVDGWAIRRSATVAYVIVSVVAGVSLALAGLRATG